MHPVGSYYLSENATSPASLFGGTWEQMKDRMLVGAGNSYSVGATGGEATHTLSTAEMPSHNHTRGNMDITGWFGLRKVRADATVANGAFYIKETVSWNYAAGGSQSSQYSDIGFQASKTWTGSTSSSGSGSAHNNMPPYRAIYMWKRTA